MHIQHPGCMDKAVTLKYQYEQEHNMEKRILGVDDEEQIRVMYEQVFSRNGYTIMTAESAEIALEMIKTKPCGLAFLDLNLPGMDGLALCRQIRKGWPLITPIAVTGYASLYELTECRDAGFEDYFIKPANLDDLMQAAENTFNRLARWLKR